MQASRAWQHNKMISEMHLYVRYLCTDLLSTAAFDFTPTPTAVIKEKEMFLPPYPLWFTAAHASEWVWIEAHHINTRKHLLYQREMYSTIYSNNNNNYAVDYSQLTF